MAKPLSSKSSVYGEVEWNLHHVSYLRQVIQEAEADIILGSAGEDYGSIKDKHKISDQTARRAAMLTDGTPETRRARRWLHCIERTYSYFEHTKEASMARLFYGKSVDIKLVAAALGVGRNAVRELRDNLVYRCTMLAASEGLIKLDDEGEQDLYKGGSKH